MRPVVGCCGLMVSPFRLGMRRLREVIRSHIRVTVMRRQDFGTPPVDEMDGRRKLTKNRRIARGFIKVGIKAGREIIVAGRIHG